MASQLPKILAKALGGQAIIGFGPLTLTKSTPGTRAPDAASGGTNPTTTTYACKGRLGTRKRTVQIGASLTRITEQIVSILGATLPTGIEPKTGDRVTVGDATFTITVDGASNEDGLGAVWNCAAKKAG